MALTLSVWEKNYKGESETSPQPRVLGSVCGEPNILFISDILSTTSLFQAVPDFQLRR